MQESRHMQTLVDFQLSYPDMTVRDSRRARGRVGVLQNDRFRTNL